MLKGYTEKGVSKNQSTMYKKYVILSGYIEMGAVISLVHYYIIR
jgi:hypothetical protein